MTLPNKMRAVEIVKPGGPDALVPGERALPTPKPNEVLIKVAAAGVNRPDVLQRQGLYAVPPDASDLPGLEIAGEVVAALVIVNFLIDLVAPALNAPDWVHQLALSSHFGQPMVGAWALAGVGAWPLVEAREVRLLIWGGERLALGVRPERPPHLRQPVPGGDGVGGEREVAGDLGDGHHLRQAENAVGHGQVHLTVGLTC